MENTMPDCKKTDLKIYFKFVKISFYKNSSTIYSDGIHDKGNIPTLKRLDELVRSHLIMETS